MHKNNENSENNENQDKKFKMSDLSELDYVKVGNIFVKKTKPKSSNSKLEEFEKAVQHDPQFFIEYFRDTLTHLKSTESINSAKIGYMTTQPQISEIMRAKLIDWLMEVHVKFNLLPETLFLTVNLIDRFLFIKKVETKDFQLLGVSAMLIGCKYEEIYPPEVRDFVYATGKTYTDVDIIKMEGTILAALQFETLHVSSFRFLEWFHLVSHDETERMSFFLAQFLLELALIDYNMLKYSSSLLAASALNFARKYLKVDPNWSTTLQTYSGYKYKDLIECNEDLARIVKGIVKSTFKIAIKKFFSPEYKKVAGLLYDKPKEEGVNQNSVTAR